MNGSNTNKKSRKKREGMVAQNVTVRTDRNIERLNASAINRACDRFFKSRNMPMFAFREFDYSSGGGDF